MAQCDKCGCFDDNEAENIDYPEILGDDEESSKSGWRIKRTINQIAITTGTGTYRRIIKCQRDIAAYAMNVLVIF